MSGRMAIDDFPAQIGGPDSAIPLATLPSVAAYLGEADNEIFLQPVDGVTVTCNGVVLAASRWLRSGDVIGIGELNLKVDLAGRGFALTQVAPGSIPVLTPPTERPGAAPQTIQPVDFKPGALLGAKRQRGSVRPGFVLGFLFFLVLGGAAVFLFRAQPVALTIEPAPDSLALDGFPFQFELGGRKMLWPGTYSLRAEKAGYKTLVHSFKVDNTLTQLDLKLEKLPGNLRVTTQEGVEILVDDLLLGTAPLDAIELVEKTYQITARKPRYRTRTLEVEVPGEGKEVSIDLTLEPLWAGVAFDSKPQGATVLVDGKKLGKTPLSSEILEGAHRLQLSRPGYKNYSARFRVTAQEDLQLPVPTLKPSDGNLLVNSEPEGAGATVNGVFRGTTPLEIALSPGKTYAVGLSKVGYSAVSQDITIQSGKRSEVSMVLEPITGEVSLTIWPPDAALYIDGKLQNKAEGKHVLPAVAHQLEVRKAGYKPWSRKVTPKPGLPAAVDVSLETIAAVKKAAVKEAYTNKQGHELRLVRPGKLTMGASRREAGRRANEVLRDVILQRPFYVATKEVTNSQYQVFDKAHDSGIISGQSLALADQPVVRLDWNAAITYCNWLSKQEGLPAFYALKNGVWTPKKPLNTGYRLLSEAEWAYVARYPKGGEDAQKYPWGAKLPVPPKAGNYADGAAAAVLPAVLRNYNDSFVATAPVGSFDPNPLGVFDLGGNVAEWVHDFYGLRGVPGQEKDPLGPQTGSYHVIRGSSWMHSTITELRFSFRDYGKEPRPDLGFRVARYLE